jgi:hypothetical protein
MWLRRVRLVPWSGTAFGFEACMTLHSYSLTYRDGHREMVGADFHAVDTWNRVPPEGDRLISGHKHVFYTLTVDDSGRLPVPYVVDDVLLADVSYVFPLPTP